MEITCTHQGNFTLALEHFHEAISLYDPADKRDAPFFDALNPGVALRCFAGWSLWFTGQSGSRADPIEEAVTLARELSEPHGSRTRWGLPRSSISCGESRPSRSSCRRSIELSAEHGLGYTRRWPRSCGDGRASSRGSGAAVDEMREGSRPGRAPAHS